MQRFSVSLEDAIGDQLRVTAARQRMSVSEFAAGLIAGALTEGGMAGVAERPNAARDVHAAAGGDDPGPRVRTSSLATSPSVSVPDIPGLVRASELLKSRPDNVDENGEIVDYASEPAEDAP